jgi:putative sigma-54 modulation protein
MKIIISGAHLEITDAIEEYAEEKLSIVKKYTKDDHSARLSVEIAKTTAHHAHGAIYKVSALFVRKGKEKSLEVISDDVYKGIDLMKDKLGRELSDEKDKELSLFKKGAQKIKGLLRK